jgi:hypothetical protein
MTRLWRQKVETDDFTTSNFTANLKLAASYYPSVSQMCRKLGINRQQFMKSRLARSLRA